MRRFQGGNNARSEMKRSLRYIDLVDICFLYVKIGLHQISFHTLAGLNCLTFERSEMSYDRKQEG